MIIYSASVRKNNHHAFSPWACFLNREEAESEIAKYREHASIKLAFEFNKINTSKAFAGLNLKEPAKTYIDSGLDRFDENHTVQEIEVKE